ncbi:hypothetical protein FRC03_001684 [Tulasnella sp. 419]|nr:hypothetical protein FRC03_001684 [Tulasnella sp. 419]
MVSNTDNRDLETLKQGLERIIRDAPSIVNRSSRLPIIDSGQNYDGGDSIHHLGSEPIQGMKTFIGSVTKEIETIERYLAQGLQTSSQVSTNALYYISVWNEVLAADSIVALAKTFTYELATTSGKTSKATVKVDVVCDDGYSWIRINTIKQSRMRAELNDLDAWNDSSDSEIEDTPRSSNSVRVNKSLDNSVYRMGQSLLEAARQNPVPGTNKPPVITLRLTRLIPSLSLNDSTTRTVPEEVEPRVRKTIEELKSSGINLLYGEKNVQDARIPSEVPAPGIHLTRQLNLDLSFLVALASDITHAPLPQSEEESIARYQRLTQTSKRLVKDQSSDQLRYSRALSNQAEQERRRSMLDEIAWRLGSATNSQDLDTSITTWTTPESKARMEGIMAKIGGPEERRRAAAMFSAEEAEAGFWEGSRFPIGYIKGLVPVKLFESDDPIIDTPSHMSLSPFRARLAGACHRVSQELKNESLSVLGSGTPELAEDDEIRTRSHIAIKAERKAKISSMQPNTLLSPALNLHTARSLQWGALTGMTTLTANRTSVKAILREMAKESKNNSELGPLDKLQVEMAPQNRVAALCIVEPRSLVGNVHVAEEARDV